MATSPSSSWSLDRGPRPPPPPPWPPRCLGREIWSLYRGALKGPLPLRLRCFWPPTRSSCSERRKMKESEVRKQAFNKYKWHNPCDQTSANGPLLGYWLKLKFCWNHSKLYYTGQLCIGLYCFTSLLYVCIHVAPWSCEARCFVPLYVHTCSGMTIKLNSTYLEVCLKPVSLEVDFIYKNVARLSCFTWL